MGSESLKEKIEVVDIKIADSLEKKEYYDSDTSSSASEHTVTVDGYVHDLEWTDEEERAIVRKIDFRLFTYVLLMTFVLNMDRTNICKYNNANMFVLDSNSP